MKYYNLRAEFLKEITGCENFQILTPKNFPDLYGKNSFTKLGRFIDGKIQIFDTEIPKMEIKKSAKLLNLLTGIVFADFFSGITIDDNLLKFITKWNLQEYRVFKLNLYKNINKKIIKINNYNRWGVINSI